MSIADATGHSTVEIELKGKKYILSALTVKDYGEIEDVTKRERKTELREIIKEFELEKGEAAKFMVQELKEFTLTKALATLKGSTRVVYHSIRKLDKDFTFPQAEELVSIKNVTDILVRIGELGGMEKNLKGQAEIKEKD